MSFLNSHILGNDIKNYLLFIVILILGLALKRITSRFIGKLVFQFFNRTGNKSNALVFISLLLRPIELLFTCVICYLAINQLDYPLNETIFSRHTTVNNAIRSYNITLIDVIDKIFVLFLILSISWIILRVIDFVGHVFKHKALLTESKTDDQIVPFVKELSKIVTIIIAVFVMMGTVLELNVATIIAGLGVGGIAIALAAQDTLQNLLGSFTIFADKPFVVGDLVHIDKYEGTIEKVGFRSTVLRTIDKTIVVIPNKKIIDNPLENLTLRNLRRMKFNLALQYDTSAATMMILSEEIKARINEHPATSDDTLVRFESFGESALNLLILYYIQIVDYAEYMKIREEINYKILELVAQHGVQFAFPSQTVYLHSNSIDDSKSS